MVGSPATTRNVFISAFLSNFICSIFCLLVMENVHLTGKNKDLQKAAS